VRCVYAWGRDIHEHGAEVEDLMLEFDGSRWMFFNGNEGKFKRRELTA